jgi:hypothetical protein
MGFLVIVLSHIFLSAGVSVGFLAAREQGSALGVSQQVCATFRLAPEPSGDLSSLIHDSRLDG